MYGFFLLFINTCNNKQNLCSEETGSINKHCNYIIALYGYLKKCQFWREVSIYLFTKSKRILSSYTTISRMGNIGTFIILRNKLFCQEGLVKTLDKTIDYLSAWIKNQNNTHISLLQRTIVTRNNIVWKYEP